MAKKDLFKVEGDKLVRTRKTCPKCGDGVFLAEHKDRLSCGACGYTEFKGGEKKAQPAEPAEQEEAEKSEEKTEEKDEE